MRFLTYLLCSSLLFIGVSLHAQNIQSLLEQNCNSCHGDSGQAGSLIKDQWQNVSDLSSMIKLIHSGNNDIGMPAFGDALNPQEISALASYLYSSISKNSPLSEQKVPALKHASYATQVGLIQKALGHRFIVERLVQAEGVFWSVDFFPNGDLLIAQRNGKLWRFTGGKLYEISGTPKVLAKGQGGLLDAKFHPDYARNGWVYLSFSEDKGVKKSGKIASMTGVVRGKIKENTFHSQETIYSADDELHIAARQHYGSRFAFKDGYVYFSIGDRGRREQAQDLSRANGKIMRLHDDGRIPVDNPFVNTKSALPHIWSYGHRNPQGMALKNDGSIWSAEHGPKGGDEVNLIEKGKNYGWPIITYGVNYSGTKITDKTHMKGMEQPKHYWTPSIAVGDVDFINSKMFPNWQGRLLVASLKSEELRLLQVKDNSIVSDDVILKDYARIREAQIAPDGSIYLAANSRRTGEAQILRLVAIESSE